MRHILTINGTNLDNAEFDIPAEAFEELLAKAQTSNTQIEPHRYLSKKSITLTKIEGAGLTTQITIPVEEDIWAEAHYAAESVGS